MEFFKTKSLKKRNRIQVIITFKLKFKLIIYLFYINQQISYDESIDNIKVQFGKFKPLILKILALFFLIS